MSNTPNSTGDLLLRLVSDAVRAVVREEMAGLQDKIATLQPAAPVNKLMTVGEAATYAGVTEATIREWIKAGRLPAARAGNRWRIRPGDLEGVMVAPLPGTTEAEVDQRAGAIIRDIRQGRKRGE